jgi:hypothetical protein
MSSRSARLLCVQSVGDLGFEDCPNWTFRTKQVPRFVSVGRNCPPKGKTRIREEMGEPFGSGHCRWNPLKWYLLLTSSTSRLVEWVVVLIDRFRGLW